MDLWPTNVYQAEGRQLGVEPAVLSEALEQAHQSQRAGLPAILTLRHLSLRTETRYEDLRTYVETKQDPYRSFRIRKRSGGRRLICVPSHPLMRVQRWLARNVLNRVPTHSASAAYAPGASAVRCARQHCGCRWLVKIDVRNFFESISEIQVFRVFRDLGYNSLISFELARLCTRRYGGSPRLGRRVWQATQKSYRIWQYTDRRIGHLPQGAPTSPMLSNLAMRGLDDRIADIANRLKFVYTRYADDLTLSAGEDGLDRAAVGHVIGEVNAALRSRGLMPNRRKSVVAPPGARKIVLGVLVDGHDPKLPRDFKRRLQLHAYYLKNHGPVQHARKRGFRSILSLQRHVYGLLSHAHQVEPSFAAQVRKSLSDVDWGPFQLPSP